MRLFKSLLKASALLVGVVVLSSASVIETKNAAVSTNPAATQQMSYKDLKATATQIKGSNLTLKEKIALKVFNKKLSKNLQNATDSQKSQVIALILAALVGVLGVHRFYLGYTWQGIVQLLTLGGCGIWALIDLIRIITGSLKPKDGEYEQTL